MTYGAIALGTSPTDAAAAGAQAEEGRHHRPRERGVWQMNKIAPIGGLLAGTSLLLYWGGEAPRWLLLIECTAVMAGALLFGFTAYNPSMPGWLRHEAVRGVALVYLGVGAMLIDSRMLISAFLIGCGTRMTMKSAHAITSMVTSVSLAKPKTEIALREEGGINRR